MTKFHLQSYCVFLRYREALRSEVLGATTFKEPLFHLTSSDNNFSIIKVEMTINKNAWGAVGTVELHILPQRMHTFNRNIAKCFASIS